MEMINVMAEHQLKFSHHKFMILLSEYVISNVTGHEAIILRELIERNGVTKTELINLLYDSCEDGGPLDALGVVTTVLCILRHRLTPMFKMQRLGNRYSIICVHPELEKV